MKIDKDLIQDDIDDLVCSIMDVRGSGDCLEESDSIDNVIANLENIINESAKVANLAEAILSRVKGLT